jgi:hypothetical protein
MAFRFVACGRCFFTMTPRRRSEKFISVAPLAPDEYSQDGTPERVKIR